MQTGAVGAEDSDTSASVSPRPDAISADESSIDETNQQVPSTANYDYSQYDYSQQDYSYPTTDYSVTVNEPNASVTDPFNTSAYGTETAHDYSAYGSQVDTSNYGTTDYNVPEPSTLPIAPLLPQQRARTPDPFSWEAQQKNIDEVGTALPPPRPPPIAKTPDGERSPSPIESVESAVETRGEHKN